MIMIFMKNDHDDIYCRFQPPQKQPDNREQIQQGGESESCMAVLNNFYGDGEFIGGDGGSTTNAEFCFNTF